MPTGWEEFVVTELITDHLVVGVCRLLLILGVSVQCVFFLLTCVLQKILSCLSKCY